MNNDLFQSATPIFLQIGLTLKLEIEDVSMPMESTLVGVDNNLIIIKTPSPFHLIEHKLTRGRIFVVRYIFDGTIFAFQTKLYESLIRPSRLLFLEYPKIIQKNELRTQKRSRCFIPAIIKQDEDENKGALLDLTKEGCRCKLTNSENEYFLPFKIADEISLQCKFPGVKGTIKITGIIKNIHKSKNKINLGINFHKNTTKVSKKIISWYISTIENYVSNQDMHSPQ
jgi:hypothetical protein